MSRVTWAHLSLVGASAAIALLGAVSAAAAADGSGSTLSLFDRITLWIYTEQRAFHRELTGHLRALADGADWRVAGALIGASFLYGVFHAAGPGHGKAVVTGYLMTHRETVKRGIFLATASAFCQGLVAIVIVYGLITLAGWLPRDAQSAVTWSERASFFLVALIGAFLAFRGVRGIIRRYRAPSTCADPAHHHDHDHHCGHAHVPTPADVEKARDIRTMLGVVLSVGIRPCTGAVIVLVFAKATALAWIGIAAVLAMSAGTALAVACLATFAVAIRNAASRITVAPPQYAGYAAETVAVAGGLFIMLIGLSLLSTAFGPAHPIMGR